MPKQTKLLDKARLAFEDYAAMDAKSLPANALSALQVRMARWRRAAIPVSRVTLEAEVALGISEEIGELVFALVGAGALCSQAVLKHGNAIRGYADREKARQAIGDAIADMSLFAMQLCTAFRLDYGTLLREVAEQVMQRDWKASPITGLRKDCIAPRAHRERNRRRMAPDAKQCPTGLVDGPIEAYDEIE